MSVLTLKRYDGGKPEPPLFTVAFTVSAPGGSTTAEIDASVSGDDVDKLYDAESMVLMSLLYQRVLGLAIAGNSAITIAALMRHKYGYRGLSVMQVRGIKRELSAVLR